MSLERPVRGPTIPSKQNRPNANSQSRQHQPNKKQPDRMERQLPFFLLMLVLLALLLGLLAFLFVMLMVLFLVIHSFSKSSCELTSNAKCQLRIQFRDYRSN